jgi:cytochrome P450
MFAIRNPELFSNVTYAIEDGARRRATVDDLARRRTDDEVATFQASDPPVHTWKRRLAALHFRPAQVKLYEPVIRAEVGRLVDVFIDDGRVEFISKFARPIGTRIAFLIVGLPLEDADLAEGWMQYDGQGTPYQDQARQAVIAGQVREMNDYLAAAVRSRLAQPRDDVLTAFVRKHVQRNGEDLGARHAAADLFSILLGGVGTSQHMLGNTMRLAIENPHWADGHATLGDAVAGLFEESIRLEAPIQWTPRMTTQDVEVGGRTIRGGSHVLLYWAAGNRDERAFAEPERLDTHRPHDQPHLSFGNGAHFCLGAPLARLEARISFETIFSRIANVALVADDPEPVDSLAFRGINELQISFDRR